MTGFVDLPDEAFGVGDLSHASIWVSSESLLWKGNVFAPRVLREPWPQAQRKVYHYLKV